MSQCWCGRVFVQDSISANMRKPPQRECWWGGEPHLRCLTGKHEDAGSLSQLASFHPGGFSLHLFTDLKLQSQSTTHTHVCTRTHKNTFAHRKTTQTCSMESANATFHVFNSPGRLSLSWKMKSYIFFLFTMSDGALAHYSHSDADTGFLFFVFLIKSKMHSLQPTSLSNLEWSSRRLFWENKNVYTAFLVIFSHSTSFTLQVCIHSFDIQTQASGRRTNQDIEME